MEYTLNTPRPSKPEFPPSYNTILAKLVAECPKDITVGELQRRAEDELYILTSVYEEQLRHRTEWDFKAGHDIYNLLKDNPNPKQLAQIIVKYGTPALFRALANNGK